MTNPFDKGASGITPDAPFLFSNCLKDRSSVDPKARVDHHTDEGLTPLIPSVLSPELRSEYHQNGEYLQTANQHQGRRHPLGKVGQVRPGYMVRRAEHQRWSRIGQTGDSYGDGVLHIDIVGHQDSDGKEQQ